MENVGARFESRGSNTVQREHIERLRGAYIELAKLVDGACPLGREKSLALTYLEDSSMRVTRAILGF